MNKETISNKQGIILVTELIMGSSFIVGIANSAKRDAWVAIVLAMVISIPIILIQCRIATIFPGKDFFQALEFVLGRIFGKGMILLYIWFAIHVAAMILNIMGEFISVLGLTVTPKIVPMMAISLLCTWGIKEGIEVVGRWAEFFFFIQFSVICTVITLSISQMEFNNIRPIFFNGIQPVMQGSFSAFAFPFTQVIFFVMIKASVKTTQSMYKVCIMGMIVGGSMLLVITLRNIFVLGEENFRYYFSTQNVVSLIHIGDFIQRLEIMAIIVYLISGYVKVTLCLLAATNGIEKLFKLQEYSFFATPITALMLYLSYILYEDTSSALQWTGEIYPYYALLFQVIFPIFIFLLCEVKNRRKKRWNLEVIESGIKN